VQYDAAEAGLLAFTLGASLEVRVMKLFIALAVLVLAVGSTSNASSPVPATSTSSVEGVVVPDIVSDREPFSFAVPSDGSSNIDISSVSGEVVQQSSTDKYGRVFLPAGLAAGAYLISTRSGGHAIGKIEIKQGVIAGPRQPLQLTNPPNVLKLNDPSSWSGHGFSPNFSDMQVALHAAGTSNDVPVLAATEDQLKLAPVTQLAPGAAQLTVTNTSTGQTSAPQILLIYNIVGHLEKTKLTSGKDRTQAVIDIQPAALPLMVHVDVASGPVDFGNGRKSAEAITEGGQAVFPVFAEHGSGRFTINWSLATNPGITSHADCECSLKTGRCVPHKGSYCLEAQGKDGRWSCMSK
jgi:hypothetical protein